MIRCPNCRMMIVKDDGVTVKDMRHTSPTSIRRRKECPHCKRRFSTVERIENPKRGKIMPQFQKRPVVIEAFQLTKETRASNENWPNWAHVAWNMKREEVGSLAPFIPYTSDGELAITTLEGVMKVNFGDWIIRGVKGELYPCKARNIRRDL